LASIPASEWREVENLSEHVELPLGRALSEPHRPFEYMYFPESSVVSTLAVLTSGKTAEISTTGREGVVSAGALIGDTRGLYRSVVQVPGSGSRMTLSHFQTLRQRLPTFSRRLNAYTRAYLVQVMQSVVCNGCHSVAQRCARWLLKYHDRVDGDEFQLTQELLSEMLASSRAAVNVELMKFQSVKAIAHSRGILRIVDRSPLERSACECYRLVRRAYDHLLPGSLKKI